MHNLLLNGLIPEPVERCESFPISSASKAMLFALSLYFGFQRVRQRCSFHNLISSASRTMLSSLNLIFSESSTTLLLYCFLCLKGKKKWQKVGKT